MAANKTQPTEVSVSRYLAKLPDAVRSDCEALIGLMRSVTKSEPKLWGSSIVGFGSYHYRYESGREGDAPLAGFAPRKGALVIYGMGGLDEDKATLGRLGKCKVGKGCLYLRGLDDVDRKVLKSLLAASVKRVKAKWPSAD